VAHLDLENFAVSLCIRRGSRATGPRRERRRLRIVEFVASGRLRVCRARPIFSCWTDDAFETSGSAGPCCRGWLCGRRADGHQVPELLFVELKQLAGLAGDEVAGVGDVCQQRKFAEGRAGRHGGHVLFATVGRVWTMRIWPLRRIQKKCGFALASDVLRRAECGSRGLRRGNLALHR